LIASSSQAERFPTCITTGAAPHASGDACLGFEAIRINRHNSEQFETAPIEENIYKEIEINSKKITKEI
jgi:hypothetical protein